MKKLFTIMILLCATTVWAQPPQNSPHNQHKNRPHNQWQNRPHNTPPSLDVHPRTIPPRLYVHPPIYVQPRYNPYRGYGYGHMPNFGYGYGHGPGYGIYGSPYGYGFYFRF